MKSNLVVKVAPKHQIMVSDVTAKSHGIPFVKVERFGPAFLAVITTGMPFLMTRNEAFVIRFYFILFYF